MPGRGRDAGLDLTNGTSQLDRHLADDFGTFQPEVRSLLTELYGLDEAHEPRSGLLGRLASVLR